MAILFHASGIPEVRKFLGMAAQAARDPRPTLASIGEEMLVRNQRRLRRGVDVQGKPFHRSRRAERDGGQTLWDRGALAASVHYDVARSALDLFSSDKRARVHYEGLTIVPKSGKKFLTIPLRGRGGMFGQSDTETKGNRTGARARHFAGTFFLRRGDRLFLMQKTGKGTLRALFMLVRSVQMKKREWMGFSNDDMEMAADKLGRRITGENG